MNFKINSTKRFFIHTLGCKVNQYESQAMRESLLKDGFEEAFAKDAADVYIINTCTVTHHADSESRHLIGLFHRANPAAEIIVTGCWVEKNADEIALLPGVTRIIKNIDKPTPSITGFKGRTKAFLKIQDGCKNMCSYCKVPFVRGTLESKPLGNIVEEAGALVANGFKELILVGICLGAWQGTEAGLIDVLKAVEKIKGDFRIRLSSIEPKYVNDELIELISGSPKICPHLHIPLQSGDDEVLRRMNRPYTSAQYLAMTEKLKRAVKDVAISTDVMVGFPGETDANFANTINTVKAFMPARTHIFTYSRREGTAAAAMGGEIEESVSKRRYCGLKAVALASSYIYRGRFLEKILDVLVESKRDSLSGLLTGYSDNYIKVLFEGPDELMGSIAPVRIRDINLTYTRGVYEAK